MGTTPASANEITAIRQVALERMAWARGFTHGLLANMTDEQLLVRAGGRGNHALWVMGHLARTDDAILSALTGEPPQLPALFKELFGENREPTSNPSDYPTRDELAAAMRSARDRVI